jgi:hypothetical protein
MSGAVRLISFFLLLFPVAALADGRHKPREPKPIEVTPARCSCWWQPVLTGLGISALVAIPIYVSRDEKGRQKRVDVQPTDDGRGAKLTARVEF